MSIILAEPLKGIGYLAVSVGQTHLCSYTLAATTPYAADLSRTAARRTVVFFGT